GIVMVGEVLSAPRESWKVHVSKALEMWNKISDRTTLGIARLACMKPEDANVMVRSMILAHDVGKLTSPWQRRITLERGPRIPHAPLGATYLWRQLERLGDTRYAPTFAVNIHHIDRGIIGENTERPHVQLVLFRLVDHRGGVRWSDGAEKTLVEVGAKAEIETLPLSEITVSDCEKMAEGTRVWSRGVGIIDRHRRRLVASSLHHILKICDIRAASTREELGTREHRPLVQKILEGGLL
ncbi:MAG: hypothetical protein QXG97_07785, partial [Nitrososphaerota archaeon]